MALPMLCQLNGVEHAFISTDIPSKILLFTRLVGEILGILWKLTFVNMLPVGERSVACSGKLFLVHAPNIFITAALVVTGTYRLATWAPF